MIRGLGGMAGSAGNDLGTLLVNIEAETSRYYDQINKMERSTEASIRKLVSRTGLIVAGVGAAVAVASVRAFAQFDQAMTNSLAIMDGITPTVRREMENVAKEVSKNGLTSAKDLAEAYYFLASAGMSAEASMAALSAVQQFSQAGNFDMARATDLLTDAQSALGLTLKDPIENMGQMVKLSDELVKAATLANASVEQFSESLTNKAGNAMRRFNRSTAEGLAVLGAFADQGIKGTEAGEKYHIVMRDLETAVRKNSEAFNLMGISVLDAEGNMNNIADILSDLEGAFDGMSDSQMGATLSLLGFQDRSMAAIIALLGSSEAVRQYQKEIENAGGTTQRVADNQLKSFSGQMTLIKRVIDVLLIDIGAGLVPVLGILTNSFLEAEKNGNAFATTAQWISDIIATSMLTAITTIADAWYGWSLIVKGGEVVLLAGFGLVESKVVSMANTIIDSINFVIRRLNLLSHLAELVGGKSLQMEEFEGLKRTTIGFESATQAAAEFNAMVEKGRPSPTILKDYEKAVRGVAEAQGEAADAAAAQGAADAIAARERKKAESESAAGLRNLHSFGVLGQFGGVDPFADQGNVVADNQAEQLQKQLDVLEDHYKKARDIAEKETVGREELISDIEKTYASQRESILRTQRDLQISVMQDTTGQALQLLRDFGMEQSGIYKAIFVAQQALLIVQTIMNTEAAAAQAMLLYGYAGPFMAGMIRALGYMSVGIIAGQTIASFEGGGDTPNGARVGGMDGRGGFLAVLHPNERVIDKTQGGEGSGPKVTVNNYSGARVEVEDKGGEIEIVLREVERRLGGLVARGGSPLSRSIERTYGLSRGR